MLNNPSETNNLQTDSFTDDMAVDIPNLDEATNSVKPSIGPSMPAASSVNSEAVDMFDGIPSLSPAEEAVMPVKPNNQNVLAGRPEKKFSIVGLFLVIIIIIALLGGALAAYNFWANSNGEAELDEVEENFMMENGSYDNTMGDDLNNDLQPNLPSAEDLGINENNLLAPEEIIGLETDIFLPPLSGDDTDVLEYQEENQIKDESLEADGNLSGNEETGFVELAPEEQPAEFTFPEAGLDYDNDGLNNAEEASLGTSPYKADTDNDMLNDREEIMIYNTDPLNPDSDGDGYLDGVEVAAGYNPNGPGKLNE